MNCKKWILSITCILVMLDVATAQSFIFGPKIGPTIALQQWNMVDRQPALLSHFAFFIESYSEDNTTSALFAQVGLHKRGSGQRFNFNINSNNGFNRRLKYVFNNLSVLVGAKRIISEDKQYKPYYTIGVRGEYTVNSNLEGYANDPQYQNFAGSFPIPTYVNKLNYGFTVGGGFQREFTDHIGAAIEFSVNPDISKQYVAPPYSYTDFFTGNPRSVQMQEVRNISLEISLILRLLRKVEYY